MIAMVTAADILKRYRGFCYRIEFQDLAMKRRMNQRAVIFENRTTLVDDISYIIGESREMKFIELAEPEGSGYKRSLLVAYKP